MEYAAKLERAVLKWFKGVPSLPAGGRKWLGENVWWIVLIGAILTGISILMNIAFIATQISLIGSVSNSYYVTPTVTSWEIVKGTVSVAFMIVEVLLLATSIQALKVRQKKGWVLLFAAWLVSGISVVVSALLTLSILGFIIGVIFGAVGVAITGYFLVEIHSQFAHVERSRGVKKPTKTSK